MASSLSVSLNLNGSIDPSLSNAFKKAQQLAKALSTGIRNLQKSDTGRLGAALEKDKEKFDSLVKTLRNLKQKLAELKKQEAANGSSPGLKRQIDQIEKSINKYSGALQRVRESLRNHRAEARNTFGSLDALKARYEKVKKAIEILNTKRLNLAQQNREAAQSAGTLDKRYEHLERTIERLKNTSRNALSILQNKCTTLISQNRDLQRTVNNVRREYEKLQEVVASIQQGKDFGASLGRALARDKEMASSQLMGAIGTVMSVALPVKVSTEFEYEYSKLKALLHAGANQPSAEELQMLRDTALRTGRDTQKTAVESLRGMQSGARGGLTAYQIAKANDVAVDFSVAHGTELDDATGRIIDFANMFNLSAKDYYHIGDMFTKAANSANVTVDDLKETMKYAGSAFSLLGTSPEQALAMVIGGSSAGKGTMSGTAFRSLMLRLASPPKATEKALTQMALANGLDPEEYKNSVKDTQATLQQHGIAVADQNGNLRDTFEILKDINEVYSKMGSKDKAGFINALAGKNASSVVTAMFNTGFKKENAEGQKYLNSKGENVTFLEYYAEQFKKADGVLKQFRKEVADNLKGDITVLGSALESVAIVLGGKLDPTLRSVTQSVTSFVNGVSEFINEYPNFTSAVMLGTAGVVGFSVALTAVKAAASGMAWALNTTIGAFKTVANAAIIASRTIATAFLRVGSYAFMPLIGALGDLGKAILNTGKAATMSGYLWTAAGATIRVACHVIRTAIISTVIGGAIVALVEGAQWVIEHWTYVKTFFGSLTSDLMQWFRNTWDSISSGSNWCVQLAKDIWSTLKGFFSDLVDFLINTWNRFVNWFQETFPTIYQKIIDLKNAISSIFSGVSESVAKADRLATLAQNRENYNKSSDKQAVDSAISTILQTQQTNKLLQEQNKIQEEQKNLLKSINTGGKGGGGGGGRRRSGGGGRGGGSKSSATPSQSTGTTIVRVGGDNKIHSYYIPAGANPKQFIANAVRPVTKGVSRSNTVTSQKIAAQHTTPSKAITGEPLEPNYPITAVVAKKPLPVYLVDGSQFASEIGRSVANNSANSIMAGYGGGGSSIGGGSARRRSSGGSGRRAASGSPKATTEASTQQSSDFFEVAKKHPLFSKLRKQGSKPTEDAVAAEIARMNEDLKKKEEALKARPDYADIEKRYNEAIADPEKRKRDLGTAKDILKLHGKIFPLAGVVYDINEGIGNKIAEYTKKNQKPVDLPSNAVFRGVANNTVIVPSKIVDLPPVENVHERMAKNKQQSKTIPTSIAVNPQITVNGTTATQEALNNAAVRHKQDMAKWVQKVVADAEHQSKRVSYAQ